MERRSSTRIARRDRILSIMVAHLMVQRRAMAFDVDVAKKSRRCILKNPENDPDGVDLL
jgi:hypothetical protein